MDHIDESRECVHGIRNGNVTALFTSSGWTFLCDPDNGHTVSSFFEIMRGIEDSYVTLLIDDTGRLNRYLKEVPETAPDLMEFSERPLIVRFDHVLNVLPELRDDDGTVPFMLATDEVLKNAVYRFGRPVLAGFLADNTLQPDAALKSAGCVIPLQRRKTTPFEPALVHFGSRGAFRLIRK
jgi:L-threonylcarbamoyladenylate synthase